MNQFKKVVTHGGVFHADETLAIYTLRKLGVITSDMSIERTFNVSSDDLANHSVLVLDIGKSYNPELGNFDHHQDTNLSATNVLVLEHFCSDSKLVNVLREQFYNAVSDIDRGITKSTSASFSQIISNVNMAGENSFDVALILVEKVLHHVWHVAEESVRLEAKYFGLPLIGNEKIRVQEDSEFIPNWKTLAADENTAFLLSPNLRGGWQLVSRDSDLFNIPVGQGQTFRHNSGFMAVYETRELAEAHALTLV